MTVIPDVKSGAEIVDSYVPFAPHPYCYRTQYIGIAQSG